MQRLIDQRTIYRVGVIAALGLCSLAAFSLSMRLGSLDLPLSRIWWAMLDSEAGVHHRILWSIRLPRTLVAALVGVCLSLSGCLLQAVMRNPLAAPHLIGVSSGAGLAGIVILILFPSAYFLLTPVAFAGALLSTLLVYALAWGAWTQTRSHDSGGSGGVLISRGLDHGPDDLFPRSGPQRAGVHGRGVGRVQLAACSNAAFCCRPAPSWERAC